ncbi:MAG: LLM class flavin-dependent oxidoreductase [Dehalococcoidia bacterium]
MVAENRVQWGIALPQFFPEGSVDMGLVRQFVAKAEVLGYHSLWVGEQIVGDVPSLEPVSLLCYAAALTTMYLGTSVLLTPLRNPVQLAKSLGSLDQMAGGRLIVGVGLGGRVALYPAFGVPSERRVRRFVEGLRVMKTLWTEPVAHYQGDFWHLEGTEMEPKPVHQPRPPIWFGARHPQAVQRAVRLGDGWMGAGSSTTEEFREAVALLRATLEQQGRDPATFTIAKRVYLAIDSDRARAERRLQEWFGRRYKNAAMASQVSVWGNTEECIEGIGQVIAAGAQLVLLNPAFDHLEHVETLAKEIIPRV